MLSSDSCSSAAEDRDKSYHRRYREHLLTPETVLEVVTCQRRCVRAVLQEQARQMMNPSDTFAWNNVAMASFDETMRATVRALKLGKLHLKQSTGEADLHSF
eukprot:scaffold6161_cov146-Skeletonema_menzelii.AAC.11